MEQTQNKVHAGMGPRYRASHMCTKPMRRLLIKFGVLIGETGNRTRSKMQEGLNLRISHFGSGRRFIVANSHG